MPTRSALSAAALLMIGAALGWLAAKNNMQVPALAQEAPPSGTESASNAAKPPTELTKQVIAQTDPALDFTDRRDFEDAQRGFIAPLNNEGVVKDASGRVIFDGKSFRFPLDQSAPDSVHPSLWRQAQLNGISGLFRVVDRIYQVRGLDVSSITFIEADTGIIVMDPLISAETAKAALDLYYQHRPKKPVVAVIYTHSHVDHFGGVRGVVSADDVKAGKVKIVAPYGFLEEAVSENLMAGNVMIRRAGYQFGNLVGVGPQASLGAGLGVASSRGLITLIPPTDVIEKTGQKMTLDGLEFEFLLAPGSEAPSEMHFFIPALKALCTAENACHTMHNFYTLRGAKTRDIAKWVGYLNQTLDMWGDQAEVLFAPHHWPVWENARVVEHIELYRDVFRYIHDQSLRLANQGYTMLEIAEMLTLPRALAKNWATRGYYGSVSHNSKAVYNFYLGYYSSNPADLHPLPPAEAAKRYVGLLGGVAAVMQQAQQAFEQGDYRWAAELLRHAVYAEPENQEARNLQADVFEQLGYQDENAIWRNEYLSGAKELRQGVQKLAMANTASEDITQSVPPDLLFNYLAIRLNGPRAAEKNITINFDFTDVQEQFCMTVKRGVLNHRRKLAEKPDLSIAISTPELTEVLRGKVTLAQKQKEGKATVEGNSAKLLELATLMDTFNPWFEIITPNPLPK